MPWWGEVILRAEVETLFCAWLRAELAFGAPRYAECAATYRFGDLTGRGRRGGARPRLRHAAPADQRAVTLACASIDAGGPVAAELEAGVAVAREPAVCVDADAGRAVRVVLALVDVLAGVLGVVRGGRPAVAFRTCALV